MVREAIEKARNIPRKEALKKVEQERTKRPVFVMQYDPRLPSITNITRRHWRSMVSRDPKLQEVFPDPPLVAYKVAPNLRSKLIRAKSTTSHKNKTKQSQTRHEEICQVHKFSLD